MIDLYRQPEPDDSEEYERAVDDLLRRAREAVLRASRDNMQKWIEQRKVDRLKTKGDYKPGHTCGAKIQELANVEHILEAVERGYREKTKTKIVSRWINRRRLRQDINSLGRMFQIRSALDDSAAAKRRRRRGEQILRAGSELLERIDDEDGRYVFERLVGNASFDEFRREVRALPDILRLLIAEAEAEAKTEWHQSTGPTLPLDRSPSVWLIGHRLPVLYERRFGRSAGRGRPHNPYTDEIGAADGPFIRFADAVLRDLGIHSTHGRPYSRETIAAYFQEAKGTPRRS